MNYIVDMQKAIDYIECNLEQDINYEKVAKQVGMSSFYFHRIFSAIVGISPAEYIRKRRLTCAADELTKSNDNILDIAIKYYFGSNESFTRAFTKFHGISPKMAKKRGNELKAFSKITLSLTIEGGSIMEYRIEKKDNFKISAIIRKFNLQTSKQEIPEFWNELEENGKIKELSKNDRKKVMGICLGESGAQNFEYGIGCELEKDEKAVKDTKMIEIPESLWVVFSCKGQNPKDINELWQKIYREYFVTSEYKQSMDIDFELYDRKDTEIWIPISK